MNGEGNPLNFLLDDMAAEGHQPDWATVTSVAPLRVRKDHEANALEVTPQSLVRGLQVGDRVLLAEWRGQPVILGPGRQVPPALASLPDVDVTGVGNGDLLQWNAATGKWETYSLQPSLVLLDQDSLSGNTYDDYGVLTVPAELRGQFTQYRISVRGGAVPVTTSDLRPLVIRINGDGGENYKSTATVWDDTGRVQGSSYSPTAFPRTAYLGQYVQGVSNIWLTPSSTGNTGSVSWQASGWINTSGAGLSYMSGGRWSGTSAPLEWFRLSTNASAAEWVSGSRAELWGYR